MFKQIISSIIGIVFLLITACQTPPDGKLQLTPELEVYKKKEHSKSENIGKGRPIHMPGWAYGQLTNEGDIWGGGPVLFYMGREDLDYNKILEKTFSEEKSHESKTESKTRASITAETEAKDGRGKNLEES